MSASEYLKKHGMHPALINSERELSRFLEEMDRVRRGGQGSLKMIPTFLGRYQPPSVPEKLMVMDIGGTNVRTAVVEMGPEGMNSCTPMKPFRTPGLNEKMNADEFFRRIAEGASSQELWEQAEETDRPGRETGSPFSVREEGRSTGAPVVCAAAENATAARRSRLGICFSFALNPAEGRDAEVAYGAKQINVPDLVGRRIGESFRKALHDLEKPAGHDITVINDASAAALGGRSVRTGKRYGGYLGFIYGTGTNLSYCAKNGEVINVESGAYCSFPTGDIDDEYDRSLIDSGQDRFEKMVSGGYMQGLYDCVLRRAVEEGELGGNVYEILHGGAAAATLRSGAVNPSAAMRHTAGMVDTALFKETAAGLAPKEVSAFMNSPRGNGIVARACASDTDREFLFELFDLLTQRSALLCSITITAAMLYSGSGTNSGESAFITAEGSAFNGQTGFREKLFAEMSSLAGISHGLHYEFHTVPEVTFRGTAVACLSE